MTYFPSVKEIERAYLTLKGEVLSTPLVYNGVLSERFGAHILFKREYLQQVRSYKIRGALNKIKGLTEELYPFHRIIT